MSNYNFSPTLDGLNNIDSNNINSDSIITDYLTINKGSSVPTLSLDNSTNSIASTSFVQSLMGSVPKLNSNNTFTGIDTFQTNINDVSPLVIKNTYLSLNNTINFSPYTTDSTYNPFVQEGDAIIYSNNAPGLVIGLQTSEYTGLRINSTSISQNAKNLLTFSVTDSPVNNVLEMTTTEMTSYLPFFSNYVDPTFMTVENQFLGDIYSNKGLISKDGFYIKSNPGSTAITYLGIDGGGNMVTEGTINSAGVITTSGGFDNLNGGVSNFSVSHSGDVIGHSITIPNNTSSKFVVDSIGNVNNCNSFCIPNSSTPLFKINGTGDINYCNTLNIPDHISPLFSIDNVGIVRNCNSFNIPNSTTPLFKIASSGSIDYCKGLYVPNLTSPLLSITSAGNMTAQTINCNTPISSDNSTKVATTEFVNNQGYAKLSGVPQTFINSNTFTQSITGVTETTADNSTRVATTAFVKNQGYSILNASNSFTGQQTLTNSGINLALRIKSSTAVTTREECFFVATGNGSYNSIVTANDSVILGRDSATMDTGVLCLTTHSNTSCGIRITNANVLMTGTTIQTNGTLQANNAFTVTGTTTTNGNLNINNTITGPTTSYATTSAHIGYVNTITSFTTPSGTGINTLGTYIWDNSGNYSYGTYQIIANIRASPSVAGASIRLAFQNVNTVITGLYGDSQQTITVGPNILKITATLKMYTTQTWYLVFQCATTYTFNSSACSLDIIRIA